MRKILVSLFALSIAFSSVFGANVVKKHNVSGNVNGLNVSSAFQVKLTKGPLSVVTNVSQDVADYVVVKVEFGVLKIGLDMPRGKRNNGELKAEVSIPSLESLNVSGAVTVNAEGAFDVTDLSAHISGASKVNALSIKGVEAEFDISGASSLDVTAALKELDVDVSGASAANINGKSDDFSVDCSGASKANVKGEFIEVSAECSGASSVNIGGKTTEMEAECSGASCVNAYDMIAENVDAEASGASSVNVNVLRKLEVELSGASVLNYKGADSVNVIQKSVSKGCSVNRR